MKRNGIEVITKNWNFKSPHWDSMWYILYVYENWNTINIKRVPDPEGYNITKT